MIDLSSSTLIQWDGLKNNADDSYINTATVAAVLKDSDDITLGNFSLTYVASSNGKYQGYVTPAMVSGVAACDDLTIEITATNGAYTGFRKLKETANYRGAK